MKCFFTILCALTFLGTTFAGLANAEVFCNPSSEICDSHHVDGDNGNEESASKEGCDLACTSCHAHCHHHIVSYPSQELSIQLSVQDERLLAQELIYISDLTYGLRLPPRA